MLSGLKVTHDAVKARRLDPFACYLLLTFGLSLAVALATTDPKLILAGNTMVNGIGGLLFLGSCIIGTPLTQVVAERVKPTDDGPEPGADEFRRKAHVLPAQRRDNPGRTAARGALGTKDGRTRLSASG